MIKLIKVNPQIIFFVILQLSILIFSGNLAVIFVPAFALLGYLVSKKVMYPFVSLLIILPLADSYYYFSQTALNLRPAILILLLLILLFNVKIKHKFHWSINSFIPYFFILIFYLVNTMDYSLILKNISYILVILTIPSIVKYLLTNERETFFSITIFIFFMMYLFSFFTFNSNPALLKYGRFSGIFSNPNGLGIFSLLFFIYSYIVFTYNPGMFSKLERIFVWIFIIAGVIFSNSRSGIFSILLFFMLVNIYKYYKFKGLLIFSVFSIILNFFVTIEGIIHLLGLSEFLRVESLETGSGRIVAFNEAFKLISEDFFFGHGIGFTEQFFSEEKERLALAGHVGGIHNSFLWVWIDTGFIGLFTFFWGWYSWFFKTYKFSTLALPIGLVIFLNVNIESWLVGSLNSFTTILLMILVVLSNSFQFNYYDKNFSV